MLQPRALLFALAIAFNVGACKVPPQAPSQWSVAPARMATRWSSEVQPSAVLPEYPRPTLMRPNWRSLNGVWQFEAAEEGDFTPVGRELRDRVLVPFPMESSLSGIGAHHDRAWYRTSFEIPADWQTQRVFLHFGAVDWEATVWLNGRPLGFHRGGYDPFSLDITEAIFPLGEQELVVGVWDPTDAGGQPRGKQVREPGGRWHSSTSGIWQTVWIESVPRHSIDALTLVPDATCESLHITMDGPGEAGQDRIEAAAYADGEIVGRASGRWGDALHLEVENARRWTPEDPFLYDLVVRRFVGEHIVDEVRSYFGLRTIEVRQHEGAARLFLNGRPYFQMGVLDQGYWPDGLYTAPSDEALRSDVELAKDLGFNMIRKHLKVEPERWYFWCDRLGLLVWQDMPSGSNESADDRQQFETELRRVVESRRNHPSIVNWVLFNEGYGQFDLERLTKLVHELDPGRLVTAACGASSLGIGDLSSVRGPGIAGASAQQAAAVGMYGALGLVLEGHDWSDRGQGAALTALDQDELLDGYRILMRQIESLKLEGLSAAVYNQLTDVEDQCTGLVTYDRTLTKVERAPLAQVNRGELSALSVLLATSLREPQAWYYRTAEPASQWLIAEAADTGAAGQGVAGLDQLLSDDAASRPASAEKPAAPQDATDSQPAWNIGLGPFGAASSASPSTAWETPTIWLRRDFYVEEALHGKLYLELHYDGQIEVWLNGVLVHQSVGHTDSHQLIALRPAAIELLRTSSGLTAERNVLALKCTRDAGAGFVDVGLSCMDDAHQ